MARRHRAQKRKIIPDPRYRSLLVATVINSLMERGKRSVAERIVYDALEQIRAAGNEDPLQVFTQAIDNVKPRLEVKSRRVGGATYQVPVEVAPERQISLALRWIIDFSKGRKGVPMNRALAMEVLEAFKNQGNAVKKREDTHKMAQANKAFAHYRW
ncbi:MAG: 30S ribosomal protein S7 [Verrucomicrobia bacterium]|nr:30S ribosomal protein S7 [Verrucomicrobiota bacterium]MBU1908497.1 30S ribosomal protein S7 [Verrucomicrobiota bacterium]